MFYALAALLIAFRLAVTADLTLQVLYGPVDDGLYVSRAFHLLQGEAFGPYDSRLLAKLPGLSLWMAGVSWLGIPYLLSIGLLYAGAGLYFTAALRACGLGRGLCLAVLAVHLFNPVTFDYQWTTRVLREPLSTALSIFVLGAMIFILRSVAGGRGPTAAVLVLSVAMAAALLVREEDRLLLAALAAFDAVVVHRAWRAGGLRSSGAWRRVVLVLLLPPVVALAANMALRAFVSARYGAPILHEVAEGEYPGLIAAMRRVSVPEHSRHVMVTQDALGKIRAAVPRSASLIDRLPPPGPDSQSCRRLRICDEWTNGFMLFWIKDAAFDAGLTPDLPRAQAYFRDLRKDIQRACRDGRLRCAPDHGGLFPRFEIRWMRSLLEEVGAGAISTVAPSVSLPGGFQLPVDPDYARRYEVATKARYGDPGGRLPGRLSAFHNPLRPIRELVTERVVPASLVLEALAVMALALRLRSGRRVAPSPLVWVALVVVAYVVVRLLALAYLSVYVGDLGPRFFFPSYAICLLMAAAVLAESAAAPRSSATVFHEE